MSFKIIYLPTAEIVRVGRGWAIFDSLKAAKRWYKEQAGWKCQKCGWGETNAHTGSIPIEIEHKDGNCENNLQENIEVLCPNCQALTQFYKGANIGNGRGSRGYRPLRSQLKEYYGSELKS
jgi:predicted nucleic-acid-binding Zn-ribbon protein